MAKIHIEIEQIKFLAKFKEALSRRNNKPHHARNKKPEKPRD